MITGSVTSELEAVLSIELRGLNGQSQSVRAAIDTGFDGVLALPEAVMERLDFPFLGLEKVVLADGSRTVLLTFAATVLWHGKLLRVTAMEAEGGALVGMALLYGSRLTMDVLEDGPVRIEAVEFS